MKEESLMKLQYLLEGLTGKKVPLDILRSMENDKVDIKNFQRECNKQMDIPLPYDPRTEKYKDIPMYSETELEELFKEKFPKGVTLTLKGVDVGFISKFIQSDYMDEEFDALIEDKPVDWTNDYLDVKLTMKTEKAMGCIWPDNSYINDEMDNWLDDTIEDNGTQYDYLRKDSRASNFVHQHPDLKGGKCICYISDSDLFRNTMIEGIPFQEVVDILKQSPDLTTAELKGVLRNIQKKSPDYNPRERITDINVKDKNGIWVRCKIDGMQQMFQRLTPEEQNAYEELGNKGDKREFLIECLLSKHQNILMSQSHTNASKMSL